MSFFLLWCSQQWLIIREIKFFYFKYLCIENSHEADVTEFQIYIFNFFFSQHLCFENLFLGQTAYSLRDIYIFLLSNIRALRISFSQKFLVLQFVLFTLSYVGWITIGKESQGTREILFICWRKYSMICVCALWETLTHHVCDFSRFVFHFILCPNIFHEL